MVIFILTYLKIINTNFITYIDMFRNVSKVLFQKEFIQTIVTTIKKIIQSRIYSYFLQEKINTNQIVRR